MFWVLIQTHLESQSIYSCSSSNYFYHNTRSYCKSTSAMHNSGGLWVCTCLHLSRYQHKHKCFIMLFTENALLRKYWIELNPIKKQLPKKICWLKSITSSSPARDKRCLPCVQSGVMSSKKYWVASKAESGSSCSGDGSKQHSKSVSLKISPFNWKLKDISI